MPNESDIEIKQNSKISENQEPSKYGIYLLNNEVNESNCETIDDYRIYLADSFKIKNIEIINLNSDVFIEFDSLEWINLKSWEVEITWKTLVTVDEITVEFSNKDSSYPNDIYKLQKFKS